MNEQLEKMIDNLLSKGDLSDRTRELLLRKAEDLGLDALDFELELELKIAGSTKISAPPIPLAPVSNKEGAIKKCPSCGAPTQSFFTNCDDCGHEFRNVEAAFTVQKFNFELLKIETDCREEYFRKGMDVTVFPASGLRKTETKIAKSQASIDSELEAMVTERKLNLISSFPIPNTKEDILEILAIGIPEAKRKLSFMEKLMQSKNKMKKAWLAKCEQIIIKARISMKDDKKILESIEAYAKQLGI